MNTPKRQDVEIVKQALRDFIQEQMQDGEPDNITKEQAWEALAQGLKELSTEVADMKAVRS